MTPVKILIVDDLMDGRVLLRGLLESHGYQVEEASNGLQALDLARSTPPDLIISDIMMPEMDGFTLCRTVKGIAGLRQVPFVFYTATYLDHEDEELGLALGASLYVLKPAEPKEFLQRIKDVINRHKEGMLPVHAPSPDVDVKLEARLQERRTRKLYEKTRDMDRLRREQALILASTGEGILAMDREGNHTLVNSAAARMLGYSADELIGKPCHATWHHTRADGSPFPAAECPIYACIKEGGSLEQVEDLFWCKDGSNFPVEYSTSPLLEEGEVRGAVVVFRDISERRQAEERLTESEEKFSKAFHSHPLPMQILNLETGERLEINKQCLELYGVDNIADLNKSIFTKTDGSNPAHKRTPFSS